MPSDSAATSSASRAFAMGGRYVAVCEHVFVSSDPARRPRLVLRLGRAARRAAPARQAGDRRDGRRAGGELRGEGVRRPHRDGSAAGAAAVPAGDRRAGAVRGVLRGVEGGVPRVRRHGAGRRGALDRRGVPRRARDGAQRRHAARDRAHASPPRARTRSGCRSPSASRARSSSRRSRAASRSPTACSLVPPDEELEFLHPLDVERLWGVGPVTSRKLRDVGITTVGEVARMDEAC